MKGMKVVKWSSLAYHVSGFLLKMSMKIYENLNCLTQPSLRRVFATSQTDMRLSRLSGQMFCARSSGPRWTTDTGLLGTRVLLVHPQCRHVSCCIRTATVRQQCAKQPYCETNGLAGIPTAASGSTLVFRVPIDGNVTFGWGSDRRVNTTTPLTACASRCRPFNRLLSK